VRAQKISIPTPRMVIGNNYSEMLYISIAKERGSMKLNWKSQGEGVYKLNSH